MHDPNTHMNHRIISIMLGLVFLSGSITIGYTQTEAQQSPSSSSYLAPASQDYNRDGTVDSAERSTAFLSRKQARKAISRDQQEPFFSRLTKLSIEAISSGEITSGPLKKRREKLLHWYQQEIQSFHPAEEEALTWFIDKLAPVLQQHYARIADTPWKFVKVSNKVAGGLPHTIGNVILFPKKTLQLFVQVSESPNSSHHHLVDRLVFLLMHEQTHVIERQEPSRYHSLYQEVWGFTEAEKIRSSEWLKNHELQNPDGMNTNWIYQLDKGKSSRWILPILILSSPERPDLPRDLRQVAISLQKQDNEGFSLKTDHTGTPETQSLSSVHEYDQYFQGIRSAYHPHEILADALGKRVRNRLINRGDIQTQSNGGIDTLKSDWRQPTFKWFQNHLNK